MVTRDLGKAAKGSYCSMGIVFQFYRKKRGVEVNDGDDCIL